MLLSFSALFGYFGSSPLVISIWVKGIRKTAALREHFTRKPWEMQEKNEAKLPYIILVDLYDTLKSSLNCLGVESRRIINYTHNNP